MASEMTKELAPKIGQRVKSIMTGKIGRVFDEDSLMNGVYIVTMDDGSQRLLGRDAMELLPEDPEGMAEYMREYDAP